MKRGFPTRADLVVLMIAIGVCYVVQLELFKCAYTGAFGGNDVQGPTTLGLLADIVPELPTILIRCLAGEPAYENWGTWGPNSTLIATAMGFPLQTHAFLLWNGLWWGLFAVAIFRLCTRFTPFHARLFRRGNQGFEVVPWKSRL